MGSGGRIDREKGDADILEHVMKGVRSEASQPAPTSEVVDLDARPWLGGTVVSAVQVQTLGEDEDD